MILICQKSGYTSSCHLCHEAIQVPQTQVFIVILHTPSSLYPISLISFYILIEKTAGGDARQRSIDHLLC